MLLAQERFFFYFEEKARHFLLSIVPVIISLFFLKESFKAHFMINITISILSLGCGIVAFVYFLERQYVRLTYDRFYPPYKSIKYLFKDYYIPVTDILWIVKFYKPSYPLFQGLLSEEYFFSSGSGSTGKGNEDTWLLERILFIQRDRSSILGNEEEDESFQQVKIERRDHAQKRGECLGRHTKNRSEQASGGGRSQRRSGTGGVREVHSSSNLYWTSGLTEGQARKSLGLE